MVKVLVQKKRQNKDILIPCCSKPFEVSLETEPHPVNPKIAVLGHQHLATSLVQSAKTQYGYPVNLRR